MLVAQQRWRRGAAPKDKYIGNAYDCRPTYILSKSTTKWFHRRTYEVGLCFTVCAGYPHCTQTTPLVGTQDTGLTLLLRCGTSAMDTSNRMVILSGRYADNNPSPICRNVVDRAVDLPDITVESTNPILPLPATDKGIQVRAFTRSTTQSHNGEPVFFTHDLWSHWKSPVLGVRTNTSTAGVVTALLWSGSHYKDANITDLAMDTTQLTLDAFWLITMGPNKDHLDAAYVVFRPDMGNFWYAFLTYSDYGSNAAAYYYNAYNVNGMCQEAISSLWDTAAAWNNSYLPPNPANDKKCRFLTLSDVSTEVQGDGEWYDGGTVLYQPADRQLNHCPIVLHINASRPWPADNTVWGCEVDGQRKWLFTLDTIGGSSCQADHLITTPASERRLFSGASSKTYADAWDYFTAMQALPPAQRESHYIDSDTTGLGSSGGASIPEYYMLTNASLEWNESDLILLQLGSLSAAQQRLANEDMDSPDDGAIIVAFTTLLVAVLTIPTHWSTELHQKLLGYLHRWPKVDRNVWARRVYIGVIRFWASAVVVGPAMFAFVTVVAQGAGISISSGFPIIRFDESTLLAQPCQQKRPIKYPGLGTIETSVVVTTVQTWAVVLVCVLSVLVILGAVALAMRKVRSVGQPNAALPTSSVGKP